MGQYCSKRFVEFAWDGTNIVRNEKHDKLRRTNNIHFYRHIEILELKTFLLPSQLNPSPHFSNKIYNAKKKQGQRQDKKKLREEV